MVAGRRTESESCLAVEPWWCQRHWVDGRRNEECFAQEGRGRIPTKIAVAKNKAAMRDYKNFFVTSLVITTATTTTEKTLGLAQMVPRGCKPALKNASGQGGRWDGAAAAWKPGPGIGGDHGRELRVVMLAAENMPVLDGWDGAWDRQGRPGTPPAVGSRNDDAVARGSSTLACCVAMAAARGGDQWLSYLG